MKVYTMKPKLLFSVLAALILFCALPSRSNAQFTFDECSRTETWLPAGAGLPDSAVAATVWNDRLYVVWREVGGVFGISTWDGHEWKFIAEFAAQGSELPDGSSSDEMHTEISDIVVYNDELYICGPFESVNSMPGTNGIVKWDGTTWSAVPGNPIINFGFFTGWDAPMAHAGLRMAIYKGELIVAGVIRDDPENGRRAIVGWNGSSWRTITKVAPIDRTNGIDPFFVTSMVATDDYLYVGGINSEFGGLVAPGVARWDGTTWSKVGDNTMTGTHQLFVYNGALHALRGNFNPWRSVLTSVYRLDGTQWEQLPITLSDNKEMPPYSTVLYDNAVAVHGGDLFIFTDAGEKGRRAVRWDGTEAHALAMPNATVRFLASYNDDLISGGSFTSSCGVPVSYVARLCQASNCAGISGRVLADTSGDCSGSDGIGGRLVAITPGPHYAVSDTDGYYRVMVQPGTYTVALASSLHWTIHCPAAPGTHTATLGSVGDSSVMNDFSVTPDENVRDIRVSIIGGPIARPGWGYRYTLMCTNVGTIPVAGCPVRLGYDARITFDSGSIAPARLAPPSAEWDLDLAVGESRTITVWMTLPTTLGMNDVLCASLDADAAGDAIPSDNTDSACIGVRASYDPNDIAVSPAGTGDDGAIDFGGRDSVLTYTVRFQNTGNDTAFRVVVIDTLSGHLDLTSVVLGASSHPFTLRIGEGGALIWDFRNILLPDSTVNADASQGYFKYSVRLRRGLAPQTQIPNRASIYFDYNAPVVTNTVISTIAQPTASVDVNADGEHLLALYPNPARGTIYLRGDLLSGGTIELRTMLGDLVRTVRCEGSGDAAIDLEGLSSGSYLVTAPMRGGRMIMRRVTVIR